MYAIIFDQINPDNAGHSVSVFPCDFRVKPLAGLLYAVTAEYKEKPHLSVWFLWWTIQDSKNKTVFP